MGAGGPGISLHLYCSKFFPVRASVEWGIY